LSDSWLIEYLAFCVDWSNVIALQN